MTRQNIRRAQIAKSFLLAALACLPALCAAQTAASSPSLADQGKIFADALKYTAQIKTTVKWPMGDETRGSSRGAGFLVNEKKGWVLTNAHVASRSPSLISLSFYGQSQIPAKKVYVDPYMDIAILEVDPKLIPPSSAKARLNCSQDPELGTPVGAMGHPGGFSYTATKGVISGKTARLSTEFLQTDAPINPGNSGGPLIDLRTGEIVGINTANIKGSQNTNFATPIPYACKILALLEQGKDPSPFHNGWVLIKEEDEPKLVRVAKVLFEKSGLGVKAGDVIVSANGQPVSNETQLVHALRGSGAGASLEVLRGGKTLRLSGPIETEPSLAEQKGFVASGALFGSLDTSLQLDLNLGPVVIHYVEPGSLAENAEINKSDFVVSIDAVEPKSPEHARDLIAADFKAGKAPVLRLKRLGASSTGLFAYIERELPPSGPIAYVDERRPMGSDSPAKPSIQP